VPLSGLGILEKRLERALRGRSGGDVADTGSWAIPTDRFDAYDHFAWVRQPSLLTLKQIVEQRRWCCSLDVALLAVIACSLARLRDERVVPLRLVASMRDGPDEGLLVADLADSRDLDLEFASGVSVEEAVQGVASCIRHRRWRAPTALTDASSRIFLNFRPLLAEHGHTSSPATFSHQTRWPPVHGEWGWDRRFVYHSLWIMVDQVDELEWVLCLKVQWARPQDSKLSDVLCSVLQDLARRPGDPLLLS